MGFLGDPGIENLGIFICQIPGIGDFLGIFGEVFSWDGISHQKATSASE